MTAVIVLQVLILLVQVMIFLLHRRTIQHKDSVFYTDYVHGTLHLRVFKPEFEFQAVGNVGGEILDRGNLSIYYMWALIKF